MGRVESRTVFLFGEEQEFELDEARLELLRGGAPVPLRPKPFEVLRYLLRNNDRVVEKEELFEAVWPGAVVSEASLATALKQIRTALGDRAQTPRLIQTYRARGYRFVGVVDERPAAPAPPRPFYGGSGSRNDESSPPATVSARQILAAAAIALLTVVGAWAFWAKRPVGSDEAPIRSIAVLPLQNLSGDPEQGYFSDGITEDLIGALSEIGGLRVPSHRSVLRFKGSRESLPEIAAALDVDALIEGTVRRAGDRVRITVQLVRGVQDEHLWHEAYEEELSDVLALQQRIARAVAERVAISLEPRDLAHLASIPSIHPDAYEAYLRARHIDRVRHGWSSPQIVELLERAVALEPNFAKAHGWLAVSYRNLAMYGFAPAQESLARARELANRSIALGNAFAERELGWIALSEWRWEEATRVWSEVIATRQTVTGSQIGLGMLEGVKGRAEGLERMRQAIASAHDPLFIQFPIVVAEMEARHRQYDAAIARARSLLEIEPTLTHAHAVLWAAHSWKGDSDDAVSAWAELTRQFGGDPSPIVEVYRRHGVRAFVEAELALQLERRKTAYASAAFIAERYAFLGDREPALQWLERAYEERDPQLMFVFNLNPSFDAIREEPRFAALAARMGLRIVETQGPSAAPLRAW